MKKGNLIYLYLTLIIVLVIVGLIVAYYYVVVRSKIGASIQKGSIKSILFIGDSNTAANFSYADQLAAAYPGLKIKKIAQNGAKTDWMLSQLQTELSKNKYDAVAILGGSNDIYATDSIDDAKRNLDAMYALAHSKGAKVLAISPPNKDFYTNKTEHKQAILRELVNWIKFNPRKDAFIDFWALTDNQNLFTAADGYLHPGSAAHKSLAASTASVLKV